MLLKKTLNITDVKMKFEDTGTFSGYASVFGGVDSYGDTIAKGAYAETLKRGLPKMFFNHEWDMPIGKWTSAVEDEIGLFVTGELTPGLALSDSVRAALKHGTLDGLSVGGMVRKGDYIEKDDGGRTIVKWSTLMEVSPVAFPADSAARIDAGSVKGMDLDAQLLDCSTERDVERLLRDAGLSKREATAIVSKMRVIFTGRDASAESAKFETELLARIGKLIK